jgi:hypothetical protein
VENAKQLILEIVEDGDTRDLRAAISQALNNPRDNIHGGLVVAALAPAARAGLQWAEGLISPPSAAAPFVPPQLVAPLFAVPLSLQ